MHNRGDTIIVTGMKIKAPSTNIKLFLDTSILINYLFPNEIHHRDTTAFFENAERRGYRCVVSDLSLLELSSIYDRLGENSKTRMKNALARLRASKSTKFIPLTRSEPPKEHIVHWGNLELADRLKLLTAEQKGCDYFLTFDKNFLELKDSPVAIATPHEFLMESRR